MLRNRLNAFRSKYTHFFMISIPYYERSVNRPFIRSAALLV